MPDETRSLVARRHQVDDPGGPACASRSPSRARAVAVGSAARPRDGPRGGETPVAVRFVAEQGGEARGRVEAGQAQPVDRSVAADQRGRVRVADERVVLDRNLFTAASRSPGRLRDLGRDAPRPRHHGVVSPAGQPYPAGPGPGPVRRCRGDAGPARPCARGTAGPGSWQPVPVPRPLRSGAPARPASCRPLSAACAAPAAALALAAAGCSTFDG